MPTMASGMEAEEETEHHLQRAIATETLSSGRRLIPTPEAKDVDYFKSFYKPLTPEMIKKWKRGLVSQEISLIDEKPPDYNLDSEDEAFRQTLVPSISEIELEKVLEKLEETEKSRGPLPPFCKEWNWGKGVIDEGPHNEAIHKYWVKKRTRLERPIKYHLLREKPIDCNGINESYVCFRRRLDKIQTRRNKQRDQSSYIRMVKLRRDLVKLLTMCKLMKNREDEKSEILDSDFKMIEARLQSEDYKNEVFKKLEYQKNKEQKRILEQQRQRDLELQRADELARNALQSHSGIHQAGQKRKLASETGSNSKTKNSSLPSGVRYEQSSKSKRPKDEYSRSNLVNGQSSRPRDPLMSEKFMFKHENAKPGAEYLEVRNQEKEYQKPEAMFRLYSTQHRTIGLCRRRVGRGGRIITDRAFHSTPSIFDSLPLTNDDSELTLPSSARQIMDDIKKMRSRHFQPGQQRKRKRNNISKKR